MLEFFRTLFSSDGFMPHGFCYLWSPGLVRLHGVSDSLITVAYASIPVTLVYFINKRRDLPFNWIFICFGTFIMACGATHAMEVWTIWYPAYWLAGSIKLITAIASVTTAILLVRLVPQAVALPSPTMLRLEIAERERAEEALSRANRRLIEAHEEERTRIARELHDDISQRVALVAVHLARMSKDVPASTGYLKTEIGEVQKLVSELGNDIQSLSHQLHSSRLETLGLASAAAGFCRELSDRHGVVIDFVSKDIPTDLSPEISLCLYRVLQEALQNAIKHSCVRQFKVSLIGISDEIRLTVHDSGVGFDPQLAAQGRGLGLTSMKERLTLVDGKLSIESQPGFGTAIHAHVASSLPNKISAHGG